MDLDDRITFPTPEGVELEVQLAGLGSRFIAGGVDFVIQLILIGILVAVTAAAGGSGSPLIVASVIITFAVWYLYHVPFEVLDGGRSPGKRLGHLRVVRTSGAPVDLSASLIRNLLRLLDGITLLYLPTILTIPVSARNQRPGDMAAGTVVIRDRSESGSRRPRRPWRRRVRQPPDLIRGGAPPATSSAAIPAGIASPAPAGPEPRWDTSAITPEEAAAIRRFLARRGSLALGPRRELALRLANGLRPKVTGAPENMAPERFLQQLSELLGRR